eukprot:gb/GECH01013532.1/.p1 GENE.gb/GECH01013532.1/~~gb/GECH01013532.1/.p1  ORF type:complete len:291 (+),score=34.57 gb/GECH01013532.1/:1-873(+)
MGNYNKKVKIDDEWFDTKYRSVVFFGSSSVGKTITINEMLKDKGHTEHGPVGDEQHAMTRCVNPFRLRIDENTSIVLIDPPGFSNLGDAFGYLDFCQNSDPVPPVQEGTEHKNITSLKKLPYKEYPPIIVFVATKDHIIENFRAATKTRLEDNFYKRCAEYIKKNFSFQPHVQAVITYSQEHENETQDWQNQKKLFRQTLQISDNDIFELEHGRENDRNNVEEQRNELQRLIYSFKKEPNHIFKVNNSNSPSGENRSRGQDLRQWINLENVLVAFLSSVIFFLLFKIAQL